MSNHKGRRIGRRHATLRKAHGNQGFLPDLSLKGDLLHGNAALVRSVMQCQHGLSIRMADHADDKGICGMSLIILRGKHLYRFLFEIHQEHITLAAIACVLAGIDHARHVASILRESADLIAVGNDTIGS